MRPAVSIDLTSNLFGVSTSDSGLPHLIQPHAPVTNDKPLDDLFAFDAFPDNHVDQSVGLVESDFFTSSFFDASATNPYGLSDSFDAKSFDLQTASGATNVSDEALAAEI